MPGRALEAEPRPGVRQRESVHRDRCEEVHEVDPLNRDLHLVNPIPRRVERAAAQALYDVRVARIRLDGRIPPEVPRRVPVVVLAFPPRVDLGEAPYDEIAREPIDVLARDRNRRVERAGQRDRLIGSRVLRRGDDRGLLCCPVVVESALVLPQGQGRSEHGSRPHEDHDEQTVGSYSMHRHAASGSVRGVILITSDPGGNPRRDQSA